MSDKLPQLRCVWTENTGEPSKETQKKLPQLRCVELTVLVSLQRKHRKATTATMCWADSTGEPQKDTGIVTLNTTCTMSDKLPQLRCVWTESTGEPSRETQKKLPQLRCVELTVLVSLQRKHRKATTATMCWADSTGEPSKETQKSYHSYDVLSWQYWWASKGYRDRYVKHNMHDVRQTTTTTMCWADSTGEPSKETRNHYFK